ncbi:MAG TPA: DUF2157 domain-containing protein [Candidatus Thermoplasmatota archaeon]|nr:DUF2157 domain-containing protein [Candidatus Thermoplasmatota archaeon]
MAPSRNRIILQEAEAWSRDGRITDEFHDWVRKNYPTGGDAGTARNLQTVLLAVAGILVIVGIVTLVSEFWEFLSRPAKFWTMTTFALLSVALGLAARGNVRTRPLAHALIPLALPLYMFAMQYAQESPIGFDYMANRMTSWEYGALAAGLAGGFAALFWGFHRYASLAASAPPFLLFVVVYGLTRYTYLDFGEEAAIQWIALGIVAAIHAIVLSIWTGVLRLPRPWIPLSARLSVATNVPWGFGLIIALVSHYARPGGDFARAERYDTTLVGVPLTALYLAILLGFALRLGLAELTAVCGLLLVGDAIWLGSDKGGLLGAVLAIFGAAIALGVLAQRGVLLRILKPRPPPMPPRRAAHS